MFISPHDCLWFYLLMCGMNKARHIRMSQRRRAKWTLTPRDFDVQSAVWSFALKKCPLWRFRGEREAQRRVSELRLSSLPPFTSLKNIGKSQIPDKISIHSQRTYTSRGRVEPLWPASRFYLNCLGVIGSFGPKRTSTKAQIALRNVDALQKLKLNYFIFLSPSSHLTCHMKAEGVWFFFLMLGCKHSNEQSEVCVH